MRSTSSPSSPHLIQIWLVLLCAVQLSAKNPAGRFVAFAEIGGHNYQSYWAHLEPAPSINVGYSIKIYSETVSLFGAIGWGVFAERHPYQIPWQPVQHDWSLTHFVPVELTVQLGRQNNFLEIGFAYVHAWGEHWIEYTGSRGAQQFRKLQQGHQYVPRVGFTRFFDTGFMLRIALTPHFYDSKLSRFHNLDKKDRLWIPLGISLGYCFR